jgi:hypothetical protein
MTTPRIPRQRPTAGTPRRSPAAAVRPVTDLSGRLLLQTSPRRVGWIREHLDPVRSGLVLSGPEALKKAQSLRLEDGYTGLLLTDPAVYEHAAATEDEPFFATGEQLSLSDPLEESVADQLGKGASCALTPTGYIHAEESEALIAAAQRVRDLEDPRVIFAVPIDVGWLRDDPVKQLIAVLQLVPGTKALMLGGQMDPLGHFPGAVANLVRALDEVPHTALLRTDLAAFGALVHGAEFTAFGTTSGLRHIVPPPQPTATSGKGFANSPHVLVPELMAFFLGSKIARRFAAAPAPVCRCAACGERALDTFAELAEQVPAAAHNAAILMEWERTLDAVDASGRAGWWQQRCQLAVDRYEQVNAAIDQPKAFAPPAQLTRWAKLPLPRPRPTDVPPPGSGDGPLAP